MKQWQILTFCVLVTFIVAGLIVLISSTPSGTPIELIPIPTSSGITVHISGAIINPGVYRLDQGSRIEDAVKKAGGLTETANIETVNLAKIIRDGEKINIPAICINCENTSVKTTETDLIPSNDSPLNINTATIEELEQLPGIGPTIAEDIIEYREKVGFFRSISELDNVPGLGPTKIQQFIDMVTVE